MTLTFNPRRTMVMTNTHTHTHKISISKVSRFKRKSGNKRTDKRTWPTDISSRLTRSVKSCMYVCVCLCVCASLPSQVGRWRLAAVSIYPRAPWRRWFGTTSGHVVAPQPIAPSQAQRCLLLSGPCECPAVPAITILFIHHLTPAKRQ